MTELAKFYGKKNLSSVMGDEKFRKSSRKKRSATAARGVSRGANAKWRPSCKQIIANVARDLRSPKQAYIKQLGGQARKIFHAG